MFVIFAKPKTGAHHADACFPADKFIKPKILHIKKPALFHLIKPLYDTGGAAI